MPCYRIYWFESFVNSERCKTGSPSTKKNGGLRALLIQKDVKPKLSTKKIDSCLRALLIQKDVKQAIDLKYLIVRLRALLIQKDVKRS